MKGMDEMWDMKWMQEMDRQANQDQVHMKEGWKYVGVWMENG